VQYSIINIQACCIKAQIKAVMFIVHFRKSPVSRNASSRSLASFLDCTVDQSLIKTVPLLFLDALIACCAVGPVPCVFSFRIFGDLLNYTFLETLGPTEPEKQCLHFFQASYVFSILFTLDIK